MADLFRPAPPDSHCEFCNHDRDVVIVPGTSYGDEAMRRDRHLCTTCTHLMTASVHTQTGREVSVAALARDVVLLHHRVIDRLDALERVILGAHGDHAGGVPTGLMPEPGGG